MNQQVARYRHPAPRVNVLSMAIGSVLDAQIREHEQAQYKRIMHEQIGKQQKAVMERHAKIQENIRIKKLEDENNARLLEAPESVDELTELYPCVEQMLDTKA